MRDQTIGDYLSGLAAPTAAPGGGATAALHAAQAAALLSMVARFSDGEVYAAHRAAIDALVAETEALRARALDLAGDDAVAFTAVTVAYRLPRASDDEKATRSAAIADALLGAAQPPAATIAVALRVIELAEALLPIGNPNVITDIAAAAEAARAAATTARVNVEINLHGVTDAGARDALTASIAGVDETALRADRITADARERLRR